MEQRLESLRRLELGGGQVTTTGTAVTRLALPSGATVYADAQLDDYGQAAARRALTWRPGTHLFLNARFSQPPDQMVGTAGFGFWNAPFGDPSIRLPALPRSTWFFFAAPPSDLPLSVKGPGRGWFASTLDATRPQAIALASVAPLVLLANQNTAVRQRLWPGIRQHLAISFAPIAVELTNWHTYELDWQQNGCRFLIDGECILDTPHAPAGPLGFVCWIDNQYLIATPRGRLAWGITPTTANQWLEISDLSITTAASR